MSWFEITKRRKYRGRKKTKKFKNRKVDICNNPNKRRFESWGHTNKEAIKQSKKTGVTIRVHSCGKHFHLTKRGI